ncbi:YadA C-terminal domain-containing protein [Morganella morganii]|uniref:YadA C-terminal domain-containing protein n=1 Tax=Morganella morganii TaxID=582 RepID=UPI0018D88B8A|nr:YadA C-terminal domain-containing protein [Morganella morganii]MDW7784654.1 YadA-like family protein [Morganella morganii]MDW7791888.1 YadA-like family protein [Morganella morganii]HCR3227497.1 YadA-like family protein [Morganella morganii]HDU8654520.1 YadA-like family protein [Morganella morganii subsp. morganii]
MKKNLISLLIILPLSYANADDSSVFYYARTSVDLSEYKKVTDSDIPVLTKESSTKLYFVENNYQPLIVSEIKNEYDRSAGISEVIQVYDNLNGKINNTLSSIAEMQENPLAYNKPLFQTTDDFAQLKQDTDNIKIQNESVILSLGELNTDISVVKTVNKQQDDKLEELNSSTENMKNNISFLLNRSIPADNEIYQLKQDSERHNQEIINLESAIQLTESVSFEQGDDIRKQEKMLSGLKADSDKLATDLKDVRKKSNTTTNVANANKKDIDKHTTKIDRNTLDILKNRQDLRALENDLRETNERLDNGLAASAALNGLFQPYGVGKLNITAAMGGYQSTQAVAVGTGYRFNENIAVKTGVAYTGSNDVMYNMAFNLEW